MLINIRQYICALTIYSLGSGAVLAHDLQGIVAEENSLSPSVKAKFDEVKQLRRLLAERAVRNKDGQLEAVVRTSLKWQTKTITVCFFDGAQESKSHVAKIANKWTEGTSIAFDFGDTNNPRNCTVENPSNVRVSFQGQGYWSYVGRQALSIEPYKQTLNLNGLDKRSGFTNSEDGVILHEFGHAIGFEHEHQSPESGCEEEFNFPYLYVAMNWPKEKVDQNMKRFNYPQGKVGLIATSFDSKSVMLYYLGDRAFKNPSNAKCYIKNPNNVLSSTDITTARQVYSPEAGGTLGAVGPAASFTGAAQGSTDTEKRVDLMTSQDIRRLLELLP